ncbi:MAG: hypothetical protein RL531_366 [Actinomycetota bacterium]|jgi:thiosulfate reductase cytochrome b subunit
MAPRGSDGTATGDALPAARPTAEPEKRRYEVRRIDIWSVVRITLLFNVALLVILVIASVIIWLVAAALGAISGLEEFLGSLLSARNFRFASVQILEGFVLVGLVMVAISTMMTTIAALIYNVFAEWTGGIEVVLVEEEHL